jgi:predicted nucleotidyltransferase
MTTDFETVTLELNSQELADVQHILKEHVPEFAVWAFGSRVKGKAKKYSDLDLVIITKMPLSLSKMADLKEAFDESDLVFKVDVVDWASIHDSFRRIIKTEKVVLQVAKS